MTRRHHSLPSPPPFRPAATRFLRALARNNRRDWFEAHRGEYEREVRGPLVALVEEMDVRLARLAPEIIGHPKRSLFRIHRDVRFARDKSPFKTEAACWFFHRDVRPGVRGESAHGGAGFYFHVGARGALVAGGFPMPPRPALVAIRERIAARPDEFERTLAGRAFRARFGSLTEESLLARVPRGYAPDHPAARWLRLQSVTASRPVPAAELHAPALAATLEKDFAALLPLVRWLNAAVGYGARDRR